MMESEEINLSPINQIEEQQKGHLHITKTSKSIDDKQKIENGTNNYELLGSVITENCPGVRTSARVIQKMKENSCRPTTPPPSERELKLKEDKALQKTPSQQKQSRVTWTNLERNFFFDALNEFGKDFEAIANYINTKLKRKSITDQCFKTKEQIRTIYYQTFHKLSSKYIKFSDDVKKPVQELYALINYGEMRRKLQFVSEKNCMKIKDLVYKGYVTVRSKGKNIRVKTPSCKALRKFNQLEDWLEDIKLPAKVEVSLRPANMESWAHVQNIAQNPLIKTSVPLQKKLINVIKTFQNKWRSRETNMVIEASKIITSTHNHNENAQQIDNILKTDHHINKFDTETSQTSPNEPLICIRPIPEAIIHRPLVSITEFVSSFNICLNSYEERIGVKIRGETLCHDKFPHKRQRSDSGCEKKSPEMKKIKIENCENRLPITNNNQINDDIQENHKDIDIKLSPVNDIKSEDLVLQTNNDKTISIPLTSSPLHLDLATENDFSEGFLQILCDNDNNNDNDLIITTKLFDQQQQQQQILDSNSDADYQKNDKKETDNKIIKKTKYLTKYSRKRDTKKEINNLRTLVSEDVIKKIRKGWTILDAGDITIGDLYIVLGQDSKLIFEYFWYDNKSIKTNKNHDKNTTIFTNGIVTFNGITTTVGIGGGVGGPDNVQEQKQQQIDTLNKIRDCSLGNKLKQLLLIANLSDRMKRKTCSCGHSCDRLGKSTKMDNDMTNGNSFISNRPYQTNSNNDNNVFRPPLVPFRKPGLSLDSLKQMANNLRLQKSRDIRGSGNIGSRQLVVQRLLPVQPGLNQSYDVVEVKNLQNNLSESQRQKTIIEAETAKNKNQEKLTQINISQNQETDHQTKGIQVEIQIDDISKENTTLTTNSQITNQSELKTNQNINNNNSNNNNNNNERDDDTPDLSVLMELSLPSPVPVNHKYLDDNTNDTTFISIPPMSPMHLFRENTGDSKWVEDNFNDFSLSSLLGHLDEINNGRDITNMDSANIPSNLSVISETSVDYMSKFAEIAASMQNDDKDF